MARIVSLVVLVAALLLIAALSIEVMIGYWLPVFLALLLVVIFRPLHRWFLERLASRERLAAGVTTATILLLFLVPLLLVFFQAAADSISVSKNLNLEKMDIPKALRTLVASGGHVGLHLDVVEVQKTIVSKVQQWFGPVALGTTQFLVSFLIGLLVMAFAVYYFFLDGTRMVRGLMFIVPVDDSYLQQLVDQFISVSRAVVLATVLSAGIQGLLAGIAFFLVGFKAIFLFTVLATLAAMVPFIGPPITWIIPCLWLYFAADRPTAAIVLAIWGTLVAGTVDNIVKPWILHGGSQLHPLLALLSVLGGMQALGAIGIFIGPIVVAFLQTLLKIIHSELEALDKPPANVAAATGQSSNGIAAG